VDSITLPETDSDDKVNVEDKEAVADQMRMVVDDVVKCVVPPGENLMGAWGLVNAK
jgi:hypothetical protein